MSEKEARAEAIRRWGDEGAIRLSRPTSSGSAGRLARYRCTVGNGNLGPDCSIQGQGNTWREAFEDTRRGES